MIVGLGVAAAVAVVAAVWLILVYRALGAARARAREAGGQVATLEAARSAADAAREAAEEARRAAEAGVSEAADRVRALQLDVEAAGQAARAAERAGEQRAEEAAAAACVELRNMVSSLWALGDLHRAWVERAEAALSTAAPAADYPPGLAGALEIEVARTREETGTPGVLAVALDGEHEPASSLLFLRSVQVVLAAVARHCDAYRIDAASDGPRLLATITCHAFDGGPAVVADLRDLAGILDSSGARATVTEGDGTLRARLEMPALDGHG